MSFDAHSTLPKHVFHLGSLRELENWPFSAGVWEEAAAPSPDTLRERRAFLRLDHVHLAPELLINFICVVRSNEFVDDRQNLVQPLVTAESVEISDLPLEDQPVSHSAHEADSSNTAADFVKNIWLL